jgi:hypothetical protein
MLLIPMMIDVASAYWWWRPPKPANKLYITPSRIPAGWGLGHPGDVYAMEVKVDNVTNLWSIAFKVTYAPFAKPLVVGGVLEGDFLKQDEYPTSFVYKINALKGELSIGITRYWIDGMEWPPVGASGSGVLATFSFSVVSAGNSNIGFMDVQALDPDMNPVSIEKVSGGKYYGCTANLMWLWFPDGRNPNVGESFRVNSLAWNWGDMNLSVRTRFDIERLEDGRRIKVYSGQNYAGGGLGEPNPYEYFYVNEYLYEIPELSMPIVEDGGWTNSGASLIGEPDGNYAECTSPYSWTGWYGFEDITLAGRVILNIDLQGYTAQPDDISWDFDPYVAIWNTSGSFYKYRWADSMGGSADWAWTGGRYYGGTANDMPEYYDPKRFLYTEYSFNRATVFIENYCDDSSREQIDAMRWYVEYSPITPVTPPSSIAAAYRMVSLAPFTINAITEDMIGAYTLTATLEYSHNGAIWVESPWTYTRTFNILP